MAWDGSVTIEAQLTNSGDRTSDEVVQLYIRDRVASVTRPVRELKGFEKITIEPGETITASFTINREDLLFVGRDNTWQVEPGEFDVWIAPSAIGGVRGGFTLLPSGEF